MREDEDVATDLAAGPGHPLCLGCSTPIDDAWTGGDLACAVCGLDVHGARPTRAMPIDRGLIAILRRSPARERAGTFALRCATCTAPLTLADGETQATCAYCKGTTLVSRPVMRQAVVTEAACWMLFQGPSRKRIDLQTHA